MSNLQKAKGSLLRRAHGVPECPCESFGASAWVAAWPGLKPLPVMPPVRVVWWLFSALFMRWSMAGGAVDTSLSEVLGEVTLAHEGREPTATARRASERQSAAITEFQPG